MHDFDDFVRRFEQAPPPTVPTIPQLEPRPVPPVRFMNVLDLFNAGWNGLIIFFQLIWAIVFWGIVGLIAMAAVLTQLGY